MRNFVAAMAVSVALLSGCGGGDDADESSSPDAAADDGSADTGDSSAGSSSASGSGGDVVNPAAAGQTTASVDGLDLVLDLPGGLACSITDDAITFSNRIGDNEITIGGGINRVDGGWMGSIALNVANPEGEDGPIAYYPAPGEEGILDESLFAVDGASMSYSGPMLKQPANDGSTPPPVDVGSGTISATCEE